MLPSSSRLSARTHHLITLLRASIDLPPFASCTLESLGLYRRHLQ
jgi:hypothetical protein